MNEPKSVDTGLGRAATQDAGVGMFSSLLGVFAMLAFLFLAAQLLIGLYATSVVSATALDAANRAARLDVAGAQDLEAEIHGIETRARQSLGPMGETAEFRWLVDETQIRLAIAVDPPAFVPSSLSANNRRAVTREAVVRRERLVDLVGPVEPVDAAEPVGSVDPTESSSSDG